MHIGERQYYQTTIASPIGQLTLGSDGDSLVGLWTAGQRFFGDTVPTAMLPNDHLPVFALTKAWLRRFFGG